MKLCQFIVATTMILTSYANPSDQFDNKVIEYRVKEDKYVVVVVEDGLSKDEAKKLAMKKASEITLKNGFRYFTVDSEEEVGVLKSDKQFPSDASRPRNYYYELFQSDNFGREPVRPSDIAPVESYSGYRLTISCYKEDPSGKRIDAAK